MTEYYSETMQFFNAFLQIYATILDKILLTLFLQFVTYYNLVFKNNFDNINNVIFTLQLVDQLFTVNSLKILSYSDVIMCLFSQIALQLIVSVVMSIIHRNTDNILHKIDVDKWVHTDTCVWA